MTMSQSVGLKQSKNRSSKDLSIDLQSPYPRGFFVSEDRLMKNVIGFIALITVLSGCGSSVEQWQCQGTAIGYKDVKITVDLANKSMLIDRSYGWSVEINENKLFWTNDGNQQPGVFDRDTGEFIYDGVLLRECEKI